MISTYFVSKTITYHHWNFISYPQLRPRSSTKYRYPSSPRVKWGAVDTVNQPAKRPLTRFCFYPQQSSHKRTTEKYFLSRLEFIPVALYCASSCRILIIAQDKCLVMNKVDACTFYEQEMISKYWVQIRNSKLRKLYLYLNTYYIVQR